MRRHRRTRTYTTYEPVDSQINVKRVATLLALAFVIALAVVVGTRLSSDAIAVLVGVVAGVAASIPTALILIVVTRRDDADEEEAYYDERRRESPPVIVVAPGSAPQVLPQYVGGSQAQLPEGASRRRFRVMGYDDEELEAADAMQEGERWYE
jgi:hypothetical protein